MTLKTSLGIGLTAAALTFGVQAASGQSVPDASDRAKADAPVPSYSGTYVDAHGRSIQRAANATGAFLLGDSHERFDPGTMPVQVAAVSVGRELEWPQIGIGFGLGMLLGVVLFFALALRSPRIRPLLGLRVSS